MTYGIAALLLGLGVLVVVAPDAIPGLTIPGEGTPMGTTDDMPGMHMP